MHVEVEARFAAADRTPLAALTEATRLGPATLGPPDTFEETDRYLDTEDGRLAAAGWACRLRSRLRGGRESVRISLKGPPEAVGNGWLHRRPEIEGAATEELAPEAWPETPARRLLLGLSGGDPLRERLVLVQHRTERAVLLDGGERIGTLTLDDVRVERGAAPPGELLVVELEVATPGPEAGAELERLATALAAMPGLVPEPRTKLERSLELVAAGE